MTLLVSGLWPGLAAALLLGLCVGALTGLPRERLAVTAAVSLTATLAAIAVLVVRGTIPGEAGLWVESAAWMLAAYLAGCLVGGFGRLASRRG